MTLEYHSARRALRSLAMDGTVIAPSRSSHLTEPRGERLRWTHGLINRIVMLTDVVMLVLATELLAGFDALGAVTVPQAGAATVLQAVAFLWLLTRMQAYRVEAYRGLMPGAWHLAGGLLASAVVSLALFAAFAVPVDWGVALSWLGGQAAALAAGRVVVARVLAGDRVMGLLRRNVVVIGANPVAERIVARLSPSGPKGTERLLAVLRGEGDDPAVQRVAGHPVAGGVAELRRIAADSDVDTVILAMPWAGEAAVAEAVAELDWLAADIVVPLPDDASPAAPRVVPLAGGAALQFAGRPLKGSMYIVKRIEDIVVASLALLLTGPVILLAALLIRLESPGPVLFRQKRPGFGREPFEIYKLRTMTWNPSDDGSVGATSRQDPRITRVGAFLRRTSIDELPQFLNVLRGEMSVVGPRPYPVRMLLGNTLFSETVERYAARYRIRPGITGLAQVSGLRSNALRDPELARRSVMLDIEYMESWSLWLDLKIMVRTALFGLRGRHVF